MIVIDMDMPKSCEKCKFFDGEDMCYVDGTYAINPSRISVRPSWCPIKCDIEDIKAELISLWGNEPCSNECGCLDEVLEIIDMHTKENSDADSN